MSSQQRIHDNSLTDTNSNNGSNKNKLNGSGYSIRKSLFKKLNGLKNRFNEICSRSLEAFSATDDDDDDDLEYTDDDEDDDYENENDIDQEDTINKSKDMKTKKKVDKASTKNSKRNGQNKNDEKYSNYKLLFFSEKPNSSKSKSSKSSLVPCVYSSPKTGSDRISFAFDSTSSPSKSFIKNALKEYFKQNPQQQPEQQQQQQDRSFTGKSKLTFKQCEEIANSLFVDASDKLNAGSDASKYLPSHRQKNKKNNAGFEYIDKKTLILRDGEKNGKIEKNNRQNGKFTIEKEKSLNNSTLSSTNNSMNSGNGKTVKKPTMTIDKENDNITNTTNDTHITLDSRSTVCPTNSNNFNPHEVEQEQEQELSDSENDSDESFYKYDVHREVKRLRDENPETFVSGLPVWEKRRDLQYKTFSSPSHHSNEPPVETDFSKVPQGSYYQIYNKLVVKDTPLKEPMNLKDLIKVINIGWIINRKFEEAENFGK